jgi:[FeFe] hydrogenase H-cluster maturation GTPase HydF
VDKPMELLPLGPVLFIDTAGVDDEGALGMLRIDKTHKTLDRVDLGVVISDGDWGEFETTLIDELTSRDVPIIAVFNKIDMSTPPETLLESLRQQNIRIVQTAASENIGIDDFRKALLDTAPADFIDNPVIVGDIVGPGNLAVLVIPIDKEAPKGRLILPQAQTIRDLLETSALCMVAKESELKAALANLKQPPKLVVTDSQAFKQVAADTPDDVMMTGFSVLYARFKGDLVTQTLGAMAVEDLKPGDNILVAEACSHHPIGEDIGRVKIPNWLNDFVGGELNFTTVQGQDFPDDVSPYKLVIHCGACMWNRRTMLNRILKCRRAGVPITNYGLVIAYSVGIFERALQPFPAALEAYRQNV